MAGTWRALLLVVGFAAMACVAQRRPSYQETVSEALRIFNQGRRGRPLFGLLEAIPQPSLNSTTTTLLNFRIKETVCLPERQRQSQECAFSEGGEERNCTGIFFMRGYHRILLVDCRLSQPEVFREKRSAESSEAAATGADSSKLPPVVRDMYERAKYDIITNILRNF